jgi:hypothetical protein
VTDSGVDVAPLPDSSDAANTDEAADASGAVDADADDTTLMDVGSDGDSDGEDGEDGGGEEDSPLPPPDVELLVQGEDEPLRLVVDDNYVYWTLRHGKAVRRAPKQGGPAETLADNQPWAEDIAVDDSFVYWTRATSPGAVMKAPKTPVDGGVPTPVATGQTEATGIALDANYVYWTLLGGIVRRATKGDGTLVDLVTGPIAKYMAIRGDYVFWAHPFEGSTPTNNGSILRVKSDGTGLATVASGQMGAHDVKADDSFVYWTNYYASGATPTVLKAPAVGSGSVTTLALGDGPDSDASGIAIDSNYVYWTLNTSNKVRKVPLAGGPNTLVAEGQTRAFGITVDAQYVYWANASVPGSIARIQKH